MDSYSVPRKLPFSKKNLPKKVVISYIVDYVIIIVLFIGFYALDAVEPFHQHFALQNYTIQYPFAEKERVPVPLLFALVVIVPIIIIAFYTLVIDGIFSHHNAGGKWSYNGRYRLKDRLWELNCGVLGLLLSSGTAFVITGALKNATGKPRPDFISRCQPVAGSVDPTPFGLSNDTICTQTDHAIMKDGFRSFPSGHSSSSWGGLFYLSLYLAGKLHIFDNRGEVWKTFVILVPTLGAALITISRIEDARHHPFDVITGSMLGALCAWVAYRQYFPSHAESWRKGRAFPIRSWGTEPVGPHEAIAEREVARDQGLEPWGIPRTSVPQIRVDDDDPEHGGETNVFRRQVSTTERLRQAEFPGAPRTDGPTAYSAPGRVNSSSGRVVENHDWESSTDESDHEVFEMQPQYRVPDQQESAGDSVIHPLTTAEAEPRYKPYAAPPTTEPQGI